MTTIVWFRQDLRLSDNPALFHAVQRGPIVSVYILEGGGDRGVTSQLGSASRWWLHYSLRALGESLERLTLLRGDPGKELDKLIEQSGADSIFWNRCYEPHAIARDKTIMEDLRSRGLDVCGFNSGLLHEPWEVSTRQGKPFKVYSPFWRAISAREVAEPLPRLRSIITTECAIGDRLDDWRLLPDAPNWAAGWENLWQPGEKGAMTRFESFIDDGLKGYGTLRDRPDRENVSRLSPHMHFGEISPRQVLARLRFLADSRPELRKDVDKFLSEIGWREFSYHLLYHFPTLPEQNWRPAFDAYPWRESAADLEAWRCGMTGYPFVDAGMRELWRTGYMHNRVRMVAASFLVKHLRLHWRHGEAWFRDTLLDADLANNSAGWQWVAGSGADAAPYFRIFNPIAQGRKFDPEGAYVRRWCPELAGLDPEYIHAPFEAPDSALSNADIELGVTYPKPIVDLATARTQALAGYEAIKAEY